MLSLRKVAGRSSRTTHLTLLLLGGMVGGLAHPARATDFVREMAKNRANVVIVTSGAIGVDTARAIQNDVLRHNENHHKDGEVRIVLLADAARAIAEAGPRTTLVFCLAGREADETAVEAVRKYIPQNSDLLRSRTSFVWGKRTNAAVGKTTFTVILSAPDGERLQRLYHRFRSETERNFRDLAIAEKYESNRLAVFATPNALAQVTGWGKIAAPGVWNDIRYYSLAERSRLTDADLEERHEVYFLDRSQNDAAPAPIADLLADATLKQTTIARLTRRDTDGDTTTVLSVPNNRHLQLRLSRYYPDLPVLLRAPESQELVDLRNIGTAPLEVRGSAVPDSDRAQVRDIVASRLRSSLKVAVPDGGGSPRSEATARFAWVLAVDNYCGATSYDSRVRRLTPEPDPFSLVCPSKPCRNDDECDDEYEKRLCAWRDECKEWECKKRQYEKECEEMAVDYELTADWTQTAQLQGTLQLVARSPMAGIAADVPVWERAVQGSAHDTGPYKSETRRLRNADRAPDPIDVPSAVADCDSAVHHAAVQNAATEVVDRLYMVSLLPGELSGPTVQTSVLAVQQAPEQPVEAKAPLVLESDGHLVIISLGTEDGVSVGDTVDVLLPTHPVRQPNGIATRARAAEKVTLKIVAIDGRTADCIAATPADRGKVALLKARMPVILRKRLPSD